MGALKNVLSDVLTDPVVDPLDRFVTFLPSDLLGLKLWTRFNQGITVTGSGVSQWDDQSGEGNHLLQGTDASRPALQGDGSILFNGIDEFLKAAAFTLAQPETIYILGKPITWTTDDRWCDGNTLNSGTIQQTDGSPTIRIYAGGYAGSIAPPLDSYSVVTAVINGASSVLQLNNDSPSTAGNSGASNMGGFTLCANGVNSGGWANNQIKEVIVFSTAHDAATRQRMVNYLANVGGLSF